MKIVFAAIATLTTLALPASATDLPCYLDYPGQTINLGNLCGGTGTDNDQFRFSETLPQLENVSVVGDIGQGRTLIGEVYNPYSKMSDGVTLFYAVQTDADLETGTLVVSSLAPYGREHIEIALPDLRGTIESYEFEILD